ncbi:arginine deiminase-related protein [Candidatus Mycobacterium wuenschmannii]|uniref:Arginine deiminase-related protein n=1 Tax=Candidatus Mycobacterium wuenschmannii TaxID=3027808 RepID=A0ABY8W172_9MYCO|nr:dimethylargininase [Candidatus Mycobacterium wuenschmannii]WIM87534.1 arginine deiminase-related protein [Candidatus Mycobacterium wuenschmannii]
MTIFAESETVVRHDTVERQASLRHYVMTPPRHFAVDYAINPWMDTTVPVDAAVAVEQWQQLRDLYLQLGHSVDMVDPVPGLPDMVYSANGGLIIDGTALVARFKHVQRQQESVAYGAWLQSRGFTPVYAQHVNEGQGDLLPVGDIILAGHGFRTSLRAHSEVAGIFDRRVVSLELVDPRFYHLDTALTVLDDTTIAFYPPAFSYVSRAHLETLFPDAIAVDSADAYAFGLNAVSDGRRVVLPAAATGFAAQLTDAGFEPIGVELPELLKGGGSVKCCTLEVYS